MAAITSVPIPKNELPVRRPGGRACPLKFAYSTIQHADAVLTVTHPMVNSGEFMPKRVTAPPIWFTVNRILPDNSLINIQNLATTRRTRRLHQAAHGARPTEPLRTGAD